MMEAAAPQIERESLLKELVEQGDTVRLEQRRDALRLRAELSMLEHRLSQKQHEIHFKHYTRAIKKVFQEEDDASSIPPPAVLKLQAQLCRVLHMHEVQMKQIQYIRKGQSIEEFLKIEAHTQVEEHKQVEEDLLQRISRKKHEILSVKVDAQQQLDRLNEALRAIDPNHEPATFGRLHDRLTEHTESKSIGSTLMSMLHGSFRGNSSTHSCSETKRENGSIITSEDLGDLISELEDSDRMRRYETNDVVSVELTAGSSHARSDGMRSVELNGSSHHSRSSYTSAHLSPSASIAKTPAIARPGLLASARIGDSLRNLLSATSAHRESSACAPDSPNNYNAQNSKGNQQSSHRPSEWSPSSYPRQSSARSLGGIFASPPTQSKPALGVSLRNLFAPPPLEEDR